MVDAVNSRAGSPELNTQEEKHEIKDESNHFFFHHHTGSDRDVCLDVLLFCRV